MKYLFSTEGSKSQTIYHRVKIFNSDMNEGLFECIVSTPLPANLLTDYLRPLLDSKGYGLELSVRETYPKYTGELNIVGLDTIARIISNIKPLKQKVIISIYGIRKVYELDSDKLETLLESLE